jgi:hypothetical protein
MPAWKRMKEEERALKMGLKVGWRKAALALKPLINLSERLRCQRNITTKRDGERALRVTAVSPVSLLLGESTEAAG